jgi:cell division protein FtsQ
VSAPTAEVDAPASPRPINPKIRARRIEVQRDAGRRRLVRLLAGAGAGALVLVALALTQSPLLDVDRIQVEGMYRTPADQVAEVGGIQAGDAMVSVSTGEAADRVRELPWVAEVSVERSWPSTVRYVVREREPLAVAATADGGVAVIDREGKVVEVLADPAVSTGLPLLEGVTAPSEAGARLGTEADGLVAAAAAVPEGLAERVTAVRAPEGGLEVVLAPAGVARLGSLEDLDDAFLALASVLTDVSGACVSVVDVAVPAAPVLTAVPGCQ